MIKTSSSSPNPCGNSTTSECVTWQGEDIACLGIEKGQILSATVKLVADEVCALKEELDLSDLDLKCVFDLCISCPEPEKTLHTVLELIINKICSLDEIIDSLDLSSSAGTDPILTLASCFQYTDADGDLIIELPHSSYTKRIANQVCQILLTLSSLQDDIQDLQTTVSDLQDQINALNLDIPDVTSDCLFVGTKSIDDAWDLLDQAFCQFRTAVGLPTDVNIAISRQCSTLNTELSGEPGWQSSPSNLAQSINNLWIAFCDIRDRVGTIEDTCCSLSCKDLSLGFTAVYNTDGDGIIISFTFGAGTDIPTGFTDDGSTGTITDIDGNSVDFNITIANNSSDEVSVIGLNLNGPLEISITAVMTTGTLTCQKCLSRKVTQAACGYCDICVTGSTGSVVIVYEDNGGSIAYESFNPSTTTTTSSTTTTTTTTGV